MIGGRTSHMATRNLADLFWVFEGFSFVYLCIYIYNLHVKVMIIKFISLFESLVRKGSICINSIQSLIVA